MKITYYPQKNDLIVSGEKGPVVGFRGRLAEKALSRILQASDDHRLYIGKNDDKSSKSKVNIKIEPIALN